MLSIGPEIEKTRILGEMVVAGGKGASPTSLPRGAAFQSRSCDLDGGD